MSIVLDGSNGVTFPNGSNPQAAPSKVLQVVTATTSTGANTTSTSFVTTGFSLSITPLFSNSKILVILNATGATGSTNTEYVTIYRGGSNLGYSSGMTGFATSGQYTPIPITYLDSPATTSSTTYTVYFRTGSAGTVYIYDANILSSLTLMEIAA